MQKEFVRECFVATAELLVPNKVKLFQIISLPRGTGQGLLIWHQLLKNH